MSKQVQMSNWTPMTAAVYAELLSNPKDFEATVNRAKAKPIRGNNYFTAVRRVRGCVQDILYKSTPTNGLIRRIMGSALDHVQWESLTRRLVNQGEMDAMVYRDITHLIEKANGHAKPNQTQQG